MRTIKFRGKTRYPHDGWTFGDLVRNMSFNWDQDPIDTAICFDNDYLPVEPETVCQFTGLHDKEGNEIWEKDIAQFDYLDKDKGLFNVLVVFGNGIFGYSTRKAKQVQNSKEWIERIQKHPNYQGKVWNYIDSNGFKCSGRDVIPLTAAFLGDGDLERITIVGNLFDNPELLE